MFQKTLKQLVDKVDGAHGAAVLNVDGLVIEAVDGDGYAVEADAALPEYGVIIRQLAEIGGAAGMGEVGEFTIEGTDRITVLRRLSDKYVVALAVPVDAVIGKARFYLRVASPDLAREL